MAADGGTLFLDEIGDMSLKTQAKVLRALQEQRIEPVGSNSSVNVDVRIITATNKDLEQEIKDGNFRSDLYFRINVLPVYTPPLREKWRYCSAGSAFSGRICSQIRAKAQTF